MPRDTFSLNKAETVDEVERCENENGSTSESISLGKQICKNKIVSIRVKIQIRNASAFDKNVTT